jgi:hypothetical protein
MLEQQSQSSKVKKGRTIMARELAKPTSPKTDKSPTQEDIARRAYEIYVERGRPEGCDLEHWLEAEAQISGRRQSATKTDRSAVRRQPDSRS